MGKINPADFGSSTPKLGPDDLEGDAAMLTIATFETVEVDDEEAEGGKRNAATLTFKETDDKVLWLNKGMVESLVEQLGDDSDNWIGRVIPVEKYVARYRGQKYNKVRVVPSEEWPKAFKEAGVKYTPRKADSKAAAPAKRGGKR
jgi:hypothetical protein